MEETKNNNVTPDTQVIDNNPQPTEPIPPVSPTPKPKKNISKIIFIISILVLAVVITIVFLLVRNNKKTIPEQANIVTESVNEQTVEYINNDYGFSLSLPNEFSKYKVTFNEDYKSEGVIYISFKIPTLDKTYSTDGYATAFNIRAWTVESWNNLLSRCKDEWGPGCSKDDDALTKNQKYVFDYYSEQSGPNDQEFTNANKKITIQYLKENIKPSKIIESKTYKLNINLKDGNKISLFEFEKDFNSKFGEDFEIYTYNKENSTDLFNQQDYILLVNNNISLDKVYKNDRYEVIVTSDDSINTSYLTDYSYCQMDNDCIIGNYFCSYGAFNKYKQILLPYGCTSGIYDYQSEYTFGFSDEKMNCHSEVTYQSAKCIKNKCVGQERTLKCVGEIEY